MRVVEAQSQRNFPGLHRGLRSRQGGGAQSQRLQGCTWSEEQAGHIW